MKKKCNLEKPPCVPQSLKSTFFFITFSYQLLQLFYCTVFKFFRAQYVVLNLDHFKQNYLFVTIVKIHKFWCEEYFAFWFLLLGIQSSFKSIYNFKALQIIFFKLKAYFYKKIWQYRFWKKQSTFKFNCQKESMKSMYFFFQKLYTSNCNAEIKL